MLRRLLYSWIVNVAAIGLASAFISGIGFSDDYWVLIVTALVFSLVNLLLKPIVKLLALPLVIITLGIVLFFVNLLMLYVTDWLVPGFTIDSFMAAVWATIVITAVNWVMYGIFDFGKRRSA
jgi:putative membrane protein